MPECSRKSTIFGSSTKAHGDGVVSINRPVCTAALFFLDHRLRGFINCNECAVHLLLLFSPNGADHDWLFESAPLEVLHCPLVFLCGGARVKGAEVSTLAGFGILLPRIQPVLAGL